LFLDYGICDTIVKAFKDDRLQHKETCTHKGYIGHLVITANSIEKAKTSQPLLEELVEQCKDWSEFVEAELIPQNKLEGQELGGPLPHDNDLLDDDFEQQFQDFEQDDDEDFNDDDYMKGDSDSDDSDDEIIRRKTYSDSDSEDDDETMVRRPVSENKNVQKELLDNNVEASFTSWSISNDAIINDEF
jgi:hypothetical protein